MPDKARSYSQSAVCAALRDARRARGWSQTHLGSLLGKSARQVSRIERGYAAVSVSQFMEMCRALDVEPLLLRKDLIGVAAATIRFREADRMMGEVEGLLVDLLVRVRAAAARPGSGDWAAAVDLIESLQAQADGGNRAWLDAVRSAYPQLLRLIERTPARRGSETSHMECIHLLGRLAAGLDPLRPNERPAHDLNSTA